MVGYAASDGTGGDGDGGGGGGGGGGTTGLAVSSRAAIIGGGGGGVAIIGRTVADDRYRLVAPFASCALAFGKYMKVISFQAGARV